jgi:DNA-binding beta-propeller fold protein YncE
MVNSGFSSNGEFNDTVSVVNTSSGAIVALIGGFSDPTGIAVAPNGAYAYVTNGNYNHSYSISIVNLSSRKITGTIKVLDMPSYITFSSDGNYAYVVLTSTITAINGQGAYDTFSKNVGIVSVIDTKTNMVIGSVRGGSGATGIATSGSYVYIADADTNQVLIENISVNATKN